MTDDRELLKFIPPIPKISGSVMRALVALAGLPMGSSQPTDNYDGGESDGVWLRCILAIVTLICGLGVALSMASSGSGRGSDEPTEEQGDLMSSPETTSDK